MRITEECIDHNAVRLITDLVSPLYDYSDSDESMDHTRIATLGEISGICSMAKAMKEVLQL